MMEPFAEFAEIVRQYGKCPQSQAFFGEHFVTEKDRHMARIVFELAEGIKRRAEKTSVEDIVRIARESIE